MEVVVMLVGLVSFAAAALRWGAESRFDVNDPDLEQRSGWQIL
jgi:hypothetical protein